MKKAIVSLTVHPNIVWEISVPLDGPCGIPLCRWLFSLFACVTLTIQQENWVGQATGLNRYVVFLSYSVGLKSSTIDLTGQTREAVATGLQRTGWLISSAAQVLAVVLIAFSTAKLSFIQQIGVGLAIAVLMDATLVRGLLVPAMMRLLGRWNWWAPAPLRWLWWHIGLHESDAPRCTPKTTRKDAVAASLPERTQV